MKTATHFKSNKNKDKPGWFVTLYRYKENSSGTLRPQYLGPMGWSFHVMDKDEDIIPKLLPIEKLEETTGDNIEKDIWQEGNMYAG